MRRKSTDGCDKRAKRAEFLDQSVLGRYTAKRVKRDGNYTIKPERLGIY